METSAPNIRDILLRRRGVIFVEPGSHKIAENLLQAFELELATLGYVPSTRLRLRLGRVDEAQLAQLKEWMTSALSVHLGADRKHQPLFRQFPDGVPVDTFYLWVRKVLNHFLQAQDQPCLFCCRTGTTHVLNPCNHVVCDHWFDGSNYSACPVCEHHVDTTSPFFRPTPDGLRSLPKEKVTFKLVDLCENPEAETRDLVERFCERKQAMSPADRRDFAIILGELGDRVLAWLPAEIPVRENVALIFGTLFKLCDPIVVLQVARKHLKTATDILRVIAAYSGADPSLQEETIFHAVERTDAPSRFWGKVAELLGTSPPGPRTRTIQVPIRVNRFKVGKLRRPLRRAILEFLEGLDADLLAEDMLRHASYWVWVGEFLHPHEYHDRFPKAARAFAIIRKKGPAGEPAPTFQSFYSKFEEAARGKDARAMAFLLKQRPGELARRLDHTVRTAGDDTRTGEEVLNAFTEQITKYSTPLLLTLRSYLPQRLQPSPVRIFWPKGQVSTGVSSPDNRRPLRSDFVRPAVATIEKELLRRFAAKDSFEDCILDDSLRGVMVPFNERTASRSAIALPRGSRLATPSEINVRLFLHWCQPEKGGYHTDLDLSVGLYDAKWAHIGVCSYYQLTCNGRNGVIAKSAGDLRDAPHPNGATEFVDLNIANARDSGVRYAVMVVNAYAGMPFSLLEHCFAGLMYRDDLYGSHFDPRKVELKFSLQGEHGVYVPLVVDLEEKMLHWLDVYSRGTFQFNNVHTSNRDIQKICPVMISYFGTGVRMSMYELGLLHAASRSTRVIIRGPEVMQFLRRKDEDHTSFLERLRNGKADAGMGLEPDQSGKPVLAVFARGDLQLPERSCCYALFPEKTHGNIAASDLVS